MRKFVPLIIAALCFQAPAGASATAVCDRSKAVVDVLAKVIKKSCDVTTDVDLATVKSLWIEDAQVDLTEHDLEGLTGLQTLNFQRDKLTFAGSPFRSVPWLTNLYIANADLKTFPVNLLDPLEHLKNLTLYSDAIESIPDQVFAPLKSLERLSIENSPIVAIPAGVRALHALTYLSVSYCGLKTLSSSDLDGLTSLKELHLYQNQISRLPSDVFIHNAALTKIDIQNNKLESLPTDAIASLNSLQDLEVNENPIVSIPAAFPPSNLKQLSFTYGGVDPLPTGLFKSVPNLATLTMNLIRDVTGIPADLLSDSKNLESLTIAGKGSAYIPENFLIHSPKLQFLKISGGGMSEMPSDLVKYCSALQRFELEDRLIKSLPNDFFVNNPELGSIAFNRLRIGSLPSGLFRNQSKVTEIEIDEAGLRSLPAGIFDGLTAVTRLDLYGNRLTVLPPRIFAEMKSLAMIELSRNTFSEAEQKRIRDEVPASVDVRF